MSTQAWGFRALLGGRRKAPGLQKAGSWAMTLGATLSVALDFLIVQKESKVRPQHHRPPPWCQAHSFHQWTGSGDPLILRNGCHHPGGVIYFLPVVRLTLRGSLN